MALIGWCGLGWLIGWIRIQGYGRLDRLIDLIMLDGLDW